MPAQRTYEQSDALNDFVSTFNGLNNTTYNKESFVLMVKQTNPQEREALLKKTYRKLSISYHPDKAENAEKLEQFDDKEGPFKVINNVNSLLQTNPTKLSVSNPYSGFSSTKESTGYSNGNYAGYSGSSGSSWSDFKTFDHEVNGYKFSFFEEEQYNAFLNDIKNPSFLKTTLRECAFCKKYELVTNSAAYRKVKDIYSANRNMSAENIDSLHEISITNKERVIEKLDSYFKDVQNEDNPRIYSKNNLQKLEKEHPFFSNNFTEKLLIHWDNKIELGKISNKYFSEVMSDSNPQAYTYGLIGKLETENPDFNTEVFSKLKTHLENKIELGKISNKYFSEVMNDSNPPSYTKLLIEDLEKKHPDFNTEVFSKLKTHLENKIELGKISSKYFSEVMSDSNPQAYTKGIIGKLEKENPDFNTEVFSKLKTHLENKIELGKISNKYFSEVMNDSNPPSYTNGLIANLEKENPDFNTEVFSKLKIHLENKIELGKISNKYFSEVMNESNPQSYTKGLIANLEKENPDFNTEVFSKLKTHLENKIELGKISNKYFSEVMNESNPQSYTKGLIANLEKDSQLITDDVKAKEIGTIKENYNLYKNKIELDVTVSYWKGSGELPKDLSTLEIVDSIKSDARNTVKKSKSAGVESQEISEKLEIFKTFVDGLGTTTPKERDEVLKKFNENWKDPEKLSEISTQAKTIDRRA